MTDENAMTVGEVSLRERAQSNASYIRAALRSGDLLDAAELSAIANTLDELAQPAETPEIAKLTAERDETRAEQADAERDAFRRALEGLAIDGVTAGANPQRDGGMSPPLWHMRCALCLVRWSRAQWKEPREHPAGSCVLAPVKNEVVKRGKETL